MARSAVSFWPASSIPPRRHPPSMTGNNSISSTSRTKSSAPAPAPKSTTAPSSIARCTFSSSTAGANSSCKNAPPGRTASQANGIRVPPGTSNPARLMPPPPRGKRKKNSGSAPDSPRSEKSAPARIPDRNSSRFSPRNMTVPACFLPPKSKTPSLSLSPLSATGSAPAPAISPPAFSKSANFSPPLSFRQAATGKLRPQGVSIATPCIGAMCA